MQTVFTSAHPRWHTIEHHLAYLKRGVANLAKDGQRRDVRRRCSALPPVPEPVTCIPELDETWALIQCLPWERRAVVVLHYYEIFNSLRWRGFSIAPKARCGRTTAGPSTGFERNLAMTRMTDHELDQHLRRTVRAVAATVEARREREPIRVLIVDDQELFRRGLVMLVGLEPGIEVVGEASDGVEGTTLATAAAPDVVLLDVRMPKRSGLEACLAIKDAVPSAKIIMLTVSDEEADLYEAVKSGAAGYLLKDSSIEEVAQVVRVVADGQSLISPSMAVKLIDEFKQMSRPEREHAPGAAPHQARTRRAAAGRHGPEQPQIARQLYISANTVKNHVATSWRSCAALPHGGGDVRRAQESARPSLTVPARTCTLSKR